MTNGRIKGTSEENSDLKILVINFVQKNTVMHSPAPHESIAQTVSRNSNGNTLFRVDFDFRPNGTIYGNYMRLFFVEIGSSWVSLEIYKLSYSGTELFRKFDTSSSKNPKNPGIQPIRLLRHHLEKLS